MADLLSSISVLLVFLTFLFNTIEKEVTEKIAKRKPETQQTEARKQFNNELWKLLFLRTLPVTIIFIVTFYSLLPRAIQILTTSKFSFWNFDELNTIFIFIEFGLLGLTIYASTKTIQLIKKVRE
jgi:H+/gluconate symporter-like permease